jgi:hypothetical protein
MTSGPDQSCAEITLRLIAGEPPSADPALASHVGSCLRCFRTAGEMRDLPQIASLMDEGDVRVDPGEAFWASFPGVVGRAWIAPARRGGQPGRWRRAATWLRAFRLPVPAAMATGLVAGMLIVTFLGGQRPVPAPAPAGEVGVARASDDDGVDGVVPPLLGDEDPWALLELVDLKSMVARAEADGGGAALDDIGDGIPTPAEEVEQLDTDDLPAVALAMHPRGRI